MANKEFTTEGTECAENVRGFLSVISVPSVVNLFSVAREEADYRSEIR